MTHGMISVENISKKYRRYKSVADGVKEILHPFRKKYHEEFWALKGISFAVKKGECVGVIGRNGSGKSTLLQILCGIMRPTEGRVTVNGRVAALLELGAGFHPMFTGRENVYLNGALMGLSKQEIDARLHDIAAFADIGDFVNQPVRTYSSGMFLRLAFAAAVHADPDVMVVDEALAVGDVAFQLKCMEKIEQMRSAGTTIVFVTQDPGTVKRYCDAACWIHEGRLMKFGDPVIVADSYLDSLRDKTFSERDSPAKKQGLPYLRGISVLDGAGKEAAVLESGKKARIRLDYSIPEGSGQRILLAAAVHRADGLYLSGMTTKMDGVEVDASPGEHSMTLEFPALSLLSGSYHVKAGIFDYNAVVNIDLLSTGVFTVVTPYNSEGIISMEHRWASA